MKSAFFRLHKNAETHEDFAVIRFDGADLWLDDDTVQGVRASLTSIVENGGEARVIIDLGNVEYVCSSFLGVLISLHKKLTAAGRGLEIRNLRPLVHEVFAVSGLDGFLDLLLAESRIDPSIANGQGESRPGVLVVDDEPAVLSLLERGLENQGIRVWTARNGALALQLYHRHKHGIALVLLDVIMPGWDGPCTLSALQRLNPEIPCCFITGDPKPYTEEALLRMGALRIFHKPFALGDLLNAIQELPGWPSRRNISHTIEIPFPGA